MLKLFLVILLTAGLACFDLSWTGSNRRFRKQLLPPNRESMIKDFDTSYTENLDTNSAQNVKYTQDHSMKSRDSTTPPVCVKPREDWLEAYQQETVNWRNLEEDPVNVQDFYKIPRPGSVLPSNLKGLRDKNNGVAVPTIPEHCFMSIDNGVFCAGTTIDGIEERYGYSPIMLQCVNFMYKGCGGNDNNFWNITSCEQTCYKSAKRPIRG